MFERKEALVKNKKFFISHEYIRKVFDSHESQRNIKTQSIDPDFKKIESIQKINISIEQPLVLFHKSNRENTFGIENAIKKDLINKNGYIDDGGFKKKLLKYYSYHNTEQNRPKIKSHLLSQSQNNNKMNENQNCFNSKRTSYSMGISKRNIQKEYLNSIKKMGKRKNIQQKEDKEKPNRLFYSVNLKETKNRDSLIKNLTDKNRIVKNLFRGIKNNNYNSNDIVANISKENKKENDFKRKREYLDNNNISYDNISNVENDINSNKSKDLKKIKAKFKIKSPNYRKTKNYFTNSNDKREKKRYKDFVNQFEFLQKIKKELNILQKSKNNTICINRKEVKKN